MTTFADSNVLLDLFHRDPHWFAWSFASISEALEFGSVVVNPIVYAEASIRFSRKESFELALSEASIECEAIPYDAAFMAGKVFQQYRAAGGSRANLLPDFVIGAHAAVRGYTLLTRDARRYRTYFPKLKIVAP